MPEEIATVFDPSRFLDVAPEKELDTTYQPCPEGEWRAVITDVSVRETTSRATGDKFVIMDVKFRVTDLPDPMKEEMGLDEPTVRGSIFLNTRSDGTLDPHRNQQLANLMRSAGLPTNSPPRRLIGAGPLFIDVRHKLGRNGETFAEAVRWRPFS